MILFKRINYLIVFVLLFSSYEINAGTITIKNQTPLKLTVNVSHWGWQTIGSPTEPWLGYPDSKHDKSYEINSNKSEKHNLVLDRLSKIEVMEKGGKKVLKSMSYFWKNR